jgi:hypothetical protein
VMLGNIGYTLIQDYPSALSALVPNDVDDILVSDDSEEVVVNDVVEPKGKETSSDLFGGGGLYDTTFSMYGGTSSYSGESNTAASLFGNV